MLIHYIYNLSLIDFLRLNPLLVLTNIQELVIWFQIFLV